MIGRWQKGWPRTVAMAVVAGALASGAFLMYATQSNAKQGAQLVRGNKPGEWRYWGADAWSTRYSALDQINAANFDSLTVAWPGRPRVPWDHLGLAAAVATWSATRRGG